MSNVSKLNIGSGISRFDGFVNIDYDENSKADYILNLEFDILPFDDNSIEYVTAHHILEHLGEGYIHCLKELYRVCKNNAIIEVVVPHHRHETFFADPTHKKPITVMGFSLFDKEINQYCKENNFSNSRLGELFNINFKIIEHYNILDKKYEDFVKTFPTDKIEEYIELYNNIIENVYIKLKVVKEEFNTTKGKFIYG